VGEVGTPASADRRIQYTSRISRLEQIADADGAEPNKAVRQTNVVATKSVGRKISTANLAIW